jgi:drug/metabolite transporter (DMT)-like permease
VLPSFLTTFFFALSVIFASRSVQILGGTAANFSRMSVALLLLGLWTATFGHGGTRAAFPWFFLSGVVGFGMGDIALFLALPRIGPRLTILLIQCLAAPIGAVVDRAWLGTTLSNKQILCGAVILAGVAIALAPVRQRNGGHRTNWPGVFFGVLAAFGQALGAIVTRKAVAVAALENLVPDGGTQAFQRMTGGILVTAIFYAALKFAPRREPKIAAAANRWPRGLPWVVLNALAGPTIGVGCFQWALATAPGGVVLAIVATTPVVTMPLAYLIDGDKPPRLSILGGIIAVAGSVAMTLA